MERQPDLLPGGPMMPLEAPPALLFASSSPRPLFWSAPSEIRASIEKDWDDDEDLDDEDWDDDEDLDDEDWDDDEDLDDEDWDDDEDLDDEDWDDDEDLDDEDEIALESRFSRLINDDDLPRVPRRFRDEDEAMSSRKSKPQRLTSFRYLDPDADSDEDLDDD